MTRQSRMPPAEAAGHLPAELESYWSRHSHSFHMPGHKGGLGASPLAQRLIGTCAFRADASETGGFDYLHGASGKLLEAQIASAAAFGADSTYYLVNGSTGGNIAALLATVGDGDVVVVDRNAHRSVFAALALVGASPVYVSPTYDHALEGFFGPTFLDPVMLKAVQPRAVHVTRPSCYGICPDIAGLVGLSGLLDIPLIVDEAHGSHFPFHDGLPPSALTMGADVVIHSLHKTLGSLTQSSMLHLNRLRVSPARIERALEMVQSSSPSALLLLSLDLASTQMVERGNSLMEVLLALSETTRGEINNIDGLHCYGAELLGRPGIDGFDPTKLIVDLAETGQSGFACAQWLMANRGIGVEFSDHRRVVCTLTLADTEASTQALVDGLRAFVEALPEGSSLIGPGDGLAHLPAWPRMELTPRQAMQAPIDEVPRHLAVDRISAEYVIPYPPGIPLLVPGELITGEILEYVGHVQMAGGQVMGTADPTAARLRVLSA